jgi:hypothetical protein
MTALPLVGSPDVGAQILALAEPGPTVLALKGSVARVHPAMVVPIQAFAKGFVTGAAAPGPGHRVDKPKMIHWKQIHFDVLKVFVKKLNINNPSISAKTWLFMVLSTLGY